MPRRTKRERLFGAACLKLTLETGGVQVSGNEIYEGALRDLGLTDAEVDEYLRDNRREVREALKAGRAARPDGNDDANGKG